MNNREIERKIRSALEHAAPAGPETLSELLTRCDHQEGEQIMEQEKTRKVLPLWARLASAAAAVLVIGGGCLGGALYYQGNLAVDSEIVLDVNPSIEIKINAKEKVRTVTARNEDAVQILDGMDLKGTDLKVAVNALLGSLVKHGYIDELANSILVTVENDDSQRGERLQTEIVEEINRILSAQSIEGAVLSQNLPKSSSDTTLQTIADRYGISLGKAALIHTLTAGDPLLSEEGLAALSINELNLLLAAQENPQQSDIQSAGTASDKAYIGENKALEAALAHAGLSESEITLKKIKLDYDDGVVEYEVDFSTAQREYEYEINASTGAVLSFESEFLGAVQPNASGSTAAVSLEEAKQAALRHAGVSADSVTFTKTKQDMDDGRAVYDIEFYDAGQEYDCEIDASTGEIISYDCKNFSAPISSGGAGISEEEARSIAQKRAPQAQIVSCKLDRDDGQLVYEIEMREGRIEYECEIRQADGVILQWEQDVDD